MPHRSILHRASALATVLGTAALGATCYATNPVLPAPGDTLAVGTWGGENAGLIVGDSIAHVHIGCTLGNFAAPVTFEEAGRFNVAGIYVLRAYPIHIGPDLPAQFAGQVTGTRLTLTVTVNDTVEKKTVTLGPVTLSLGRDPRMGPCPICDRPEESTVKFIYHRGHKGHRESVNELGSWLRRPRAKGSAVSSVSTVSSVVGSSRRNVARPRYPRSRDRDAQR